VTRYNSPENQPPVYHAPGNATVYPKPKRKVWPWIVGAIVGLIILGCGIGALALGSAANQAGRSLETVTIPATGTPHGPAQKAGKAAAAKSVGIGEGLWEVGKDVKPGKYKTAGAADSIIPMCYWHTAKTDGDESIINQGVTDKPNAQGRVTLKAGQFFKTSGCKTWVPVS
jgi:hypothetical protein